MLSRMKFGAAVCLIACLSQSGAKPMDLQMGARGFGMGGAFSAVANDATAAYWNPAGLSRIRSITLSESNWMFQDVSDLNVNYFTGAIPIAGVGTVAGSWLLEYALLKQGYADTYQEQSWYEHGFSLAGGRQLWDKLGPFMRTSVGVGLNRHVMSSGDINGAGTGFDVGFLTQLPRGFRVGLVGKNLGADMMGDKVDAEYRLGLAYQWSNPKHRVIVAADFERKSDVEYSGTDGVDNNYKGFGGVEYTFKKNPWSLSLRSGVNNNLINARDGIVYTFGAGAGFTGLSLQYAFQSDSRDDVSLGNTHRITLEVSLDAFRHGAQGGEAAPAPDGDE
jgi:hypothetical protein